MSRGPLAEDEHSKKGIVGGAAGRRPPPPHFLLCYAHPLPGVPLTFLFAFHTEIHGKSLLLSHANEHANANANAICFLIAGSFVVFFMLGNV